MVERCNSVPNLGTQVIQPPGNTVVNWRGVGGGGGAESHTDLRRVRVC